MDASGGMGEQEEAERAKEQVLEQDGEKENAHSEVEVEKKNEEVQEREQVEVESTGGASLDPVAEEVETETSSPQASSVEQVPQQGLSTPSVQPNSHQQQHQVAGPRPAPAYRVVDAVIDKRDDGPGPRCGHTLTAVAAVNEEGSPGYIGPRLILFGGATALEGSSAAGPQAASPGAGIRMFLPHFSSL